MNINILPLIMLGTVVASAQNYTVRLAKDVPDLAPEISLGMPVNWPVSTLSHPIGTNTSVKSPSILMSVNQLTQCVATNAAAYQAYLAVKKEQEEAPKRTEMQAARDLFQELKDYDALVSPTAAQVGAHVKKINKLLIKIGPQLLELYEQSQR